jgi:hypothetical protein
MPLAADLDEKWQVVIVGVAVVQKAAFLDHELARVHARPIAAIPTHRPRAGGALERFDGEANVLALLVFAEAKYLLPAIAVAVFTSNCWKMRSSRQTPAREPYSFIDSMARLRTPSGNG